MEFMNFASIARVHRYNSVAGVSIRCTQNYGWLFSSKLGRVSYLTHTTVRLHGLTFSIEMVLFHCAFGALKSRCPLTITVTKEDVCLTGEKQLFQG